MIAKLVLAGAMIGIGAYNQLIIHKDSLKMLAVAPIIGGTEEPRGNMTSSRKGESSNSLDVNKLISKFGKSTKAEAFIGKENVEETELRMGAEDFAFYSHKIPACFFRLGTGNVAKGITIGGHTPTFNVDEDAIELGIGMMALLGATNAE